MDEMPSYVRDEDRSRSWKSLLPVLSIKLVVISLLFLVALFSFAFIAHEAVLEREADFDQRVFHLLSAYSIKEVLQIMTGFTYFGSSSFLFPAYTFLIGYFIFRGKRRIAINIAVIALSSTAMLHLLKRIFQRQRPDLPLITSLKTYSFPSGHALSSFIFSMIIVHLIWETNLGLLWKWTCSIMLLLFSFCIGVSRIFLKVHYASDVIAGFCLGLVWVVLAFWLLKKIERRDAEINHQVQQ